MEALTYHTSISSRERNYALFQMCNKITKNSILGFSYGDSIANTPQLELNIPRYSESMSVRFSHPY